VKFRREDYTVNGHLLPEELVQLIKEDRWVKTAWDVFSKCNNIEEARRIAAVLPAWNHTLHDCLDNNGRFPIADVYFYGVSRMVNQTRRNFDHTDPSYRWTGEPLEDDPPGNIDPSQIVTIGYQGDGTDSELLLDYSLSSDMPRVVAGHWDLSRERIHSDPKWKGYWGPHFREVAADFAAFADMLSL